MHVDRFNELLASGKLMWDTKKKKYVLDGNEQLLFDAPKEYKNHMAIHPEPQKVTGNLVLDIKIKKTLEKEAKKHVAYAKSWLETVEENINKENLQDMANFQAEHGRKKNPGNGILDAVKPKQKHKFNAKSVTVKEKTFDSKLEAYLHELLVKYKVQFEWQKDFEIQPKCKWQGQSIQNISWIADFYIPKLKMVIDTKGMPTPDFKLKLKMFKYACTEGRFDVERIELPSKKNECLVLAISLKKYFE